ncbi:MAG: hypothetical protein ABDH18_05360 [Aquificaceae bacterium]
MAIRKGVWTALFLGFILSCGVKSDTKPLKPPQFEFYRIGRSVFIRPLEEGIVADGFSKLGPYLVVQNEEAFCFVVRNKSSGLKKCVNRANTEIPRYSIQRLNGFSYIRPAGEGEFLLFRLKDGMVSLEKGMRVSEPLSFGCFWLVKKSQEGFSQPAEFCIEPDLPKEVSNVQIFTAWGKKFISWSYEGDYLKFVILLDGKEVYSTTGFYAPFFEGGELSIQVIGINGERGRPLKVYP